MKNQIDDFLQRPLRYWHIDGLTEFVFAAVFLILGVYFYVQARLPHDSPVFVFLDSFLFLIVIGVSLLAVKVLKLVKERVTFPRTGYISFKKQRRKGRLATIVFAALTAFAVGYMFVTYPVSSDWMAAVTGGLGAFGLFWMGYNAGVTRFYLLSFSSLVFGLSLSILGYGDILGLAYYYLIFSLAMLISGGITFWRYIKNTQPAEEDMNE